MSSKLQIDIVADAKGVGRGVNEAEGSLGKLGSIGKKAGLAAAAGLAVAGAAAVKFGIDSIGAASDVEQSFGALDSIYGKNSAQVKKWAEGAAEDVGLAKAEYANLSALVGAQLKGMGMETDKAAGKSKDLIAMGADLSATFGGSVSDAVGAVSSLLKGERDPIERYGVSIKAADVEAKKLAMGLTGLTGEAAKQADATATLALLTEQTTAAQGAFGRESDTLAGKQERLGAKFTNLKATIGEKLLPVATELVGWASDKMLPAAERLGKWLGEKLGPIMGDVGAWITDKLVPAARRLYDWFVDKIAPKLRDYVEPIIARIKAGFGDLSAALERNEPAFRKVGNVIRRVAEWAAEHLLPKLSKLVQFMYGTLFTSLQVGIDWFGNLVGWIESGVNAVKDLIEWFKKLKMPDIDLTPWDGWVPGAAGNVVTVGHRLVGDAPGYGGTSPFTTAAAGASSGAPWAALRAAGPSGASIDARTILSVRVDGAGIVDEHAVAQRIAEVLARWAQRLGRPVSDLIGALA